MLHYRDVRKESLNVTQAAECWELHRRRQRRGECTRESFELGMGVISKVGLSTFQWSALILLLLLV